VSSLREILRSLRIQQWAKNVFILVPLFTAHRWTDPDRLVDAVLAFLAFSSVASGGYLVNDLLDLEADRVHPTKRHRPLAAGTLSPTVAAVILVAVGLAVSALFLDASATLMLGGYLALTLAYSLYLKQRLMLDVILLAGLYAYRILIGGVATDVPISPWLLVFSSFFFVSLALVKRYVELDVARDAQQREVARRAYTTDDIEAIFSMGLVSGYLSILVLCLYVSSDAVAELYSRPSLLWGLCPIMLYWVSRIWLLARRKTIEDDPVAFAIRDSQSYLCVGLLVAVAAAAL
jgi:4-hydroxybenzoate polyprenyltransferase